jgi:predicted acetylornithine/succinylornithine family transaminase
VTTDLGTLQSIDARVEMQTYTRAPIAFVSGAGCTLVASDGRRYLDLLAGIAVTSLGHCHPDVVEAIRAQAGELDHISNLYLHPIQVALAERLVGINGWGKVFFANSGAEANECALKLARRVSVDRHGAPRSRVVALTDSFHGRTFATLAATGQPGKHARFQPLPDWFVHVAPDDPTALAAAIDDTTGAVLLEIIQGEGGVRPIGDDMLVAARERCDAVGAVLIIDEVQTGIGRTGSWFAYQQTPIVPDIITLAKALGGGLPISACIATEEIAASFAPGDHATTFGGGPIPCAAALTTLEVIDRDGLVAAAAERGAQLETGLRALTDPRIVAVRGRGLLQGVLLTAPIADAVVTGARDRGVIIGTAGPDVIRFAPPLVVSASEIDTALGVVADALAEVP